MSDFRDKQTRIFAAELMTNLPKLDLHRTYRGDNDSRIDQFLYNLTTAGKTEGEIIFGAGTGKLKKDTIKILKQHPLVIHIIEKGGRCIVLL